MIKVAILGAGQIGRSVRTMIDRMEAVITKTSIVPGPLYQTFVIDSNLGMEKKTPFDISMDLSTCSTKDLTSLLIKTGAEYVINALPFYLNDKVASAVVNAKCHYIDFTEDDEMAEKVQEIFRKTDLLCAVKCGLAPGFINYVGYDLTKDIFSPETLMVSVGALPRTVSLDENNPGLSYNLTWSVDGLVNEYIRPCRVRKDGKIDTVKALDGLTRVILDGIEYEAAYTSGGIGSLINDLTNVPNVHYMTLRYPMHYEYIKECIESSHGNFNLLKKHFLKTFPSTRDDVIVVYANCIGRDQYNNLARKSFYKKFYGVDGFTGIQATTASAGVAMLELMIRHQNKIEMFSSNIINHADVSLQTFQNTISFRKYYNTASVL